MKLCYLINQYPKVSHSFIRREILELEAQGASVWRMALRGWRERPIDPQDVVDAANTIVFNARIYTVNPKQPWAEALAVRDGRILLIGGTKEVMAHKGPLTKIIDAQQHVVLPGFTDCHIHFMEGSLGLTHVDLNGAGTVA